MDIFNKFPDEWRKQQRDELIDKIIDAVIGLMLVAIIAWLFWPKDVDAARFNYPIGYSVLRDDKPFVQELSYDDQKTMDKWKSNPKTEYILKELTLQNYIWQFLTDEMGLSDVCAAGIFGNMMVECGSRSFNLHPYVYSPGGYYYGLCQWNTYGHHSSIAGGSLEEQLQYLDDTIISEMGRSTYQSFCSSTTPEQAANIFGQWYERCSEPYGRQAEARRAYERFGN